ncbi:hypothetical protein Pan258_60560 [Symmachiella dynata]|uniref:DUF4159 domain-containing protein n=1 Tax=Symmachiella dynata TaxID=2527995 RepID=UPI00118D388E|nr:DUF4159 domain-containing protein [Symmachiella dynata]QDT51959.1 hypothetical protein Pan258_60560 [Symmachiella dynata]
MRCGIARHFLIVICSLAILASSHRHAQAEITAHQVHESIDNGVKFLLRKQKSDGSWASGGSWDIGVTSLTALALFNAKVPADHPQMALTLRYLRNSSNEPNRTYEVALMIMALAAAKDGGRDGGRIAKLVEKLEDSQIRRGEGRGGWSYGTAPGGRLNIQGGDNSNSQYAVLALRDAQEYGVEVSTATWERIRAHWLGAQNVDGGWGYSLTSKSSTGSMTVAGIASMVIVHSMLSDDANEIDEDGHPICCGTPEEDPYLKALERGVEWMTRNFAVGMNPKAHTWQLYYLYGLERAGRLSARRFFGQHDWYREGAEYLVARQHQFAGSWKGSGHMEDEIISTSFALLFLSKGLAPVLVNKLKYGPRDNNGRLTEQDWDNHHNDVNNLTKHISGLEKWPKLLTWQQVDSRAATVTDLHQAPVVFISGRYGYDFTEAERGKLKEYVSGGGTIFVESCCDGEDFDRSFREMIRKMYPDGEAELVRLGPDHEVYRSEYRLDSETVELWGVELGCRTVIIYSPDDLSCLWDKWRLRIPEKRAPALTSMVLRAMKVGVNVIAYATGRELMEKLDDNRLAADEGAQVKVSRGLLQVAKIRHAGSWNTAPTALRNMLFALNDKLGMVASTTERDLVAVDDNIFKYPILYMHGRHRFEFSRQEQENLRKYLDQGGFLFADACCGAPQFDKSFRELMEQIYPDAPLKRLPMDHEIFTSQLGGFDIRKVQRRAPESGSTKVTLKSNVFEVEPLLEGIEIDGRIAVIYSKFDISCALERQSSVACAGYVHEDAVKIALNVVLYSIAQ